MTLTKCSNRDKICFILGNSKICYFIMEDKTIEIAKISLMDIMNHPENQNYYILINRSVIINTQYFVNVFNSKERLILMKTGNILKVSRKHWFNFK